MSKKKSAKASNRAVDVPPPPAEVLDSVPSAAATVRQRRNRRLLLIGIVVVGIPVAEVVAYQFRSILIVIRNDSPQPIRSALATFPDGKVEIGEILPGGEATRVIRPRYSFGRNHFSSYLFTLRVRSADGVISYFNPHEGTVDYSAQEVFTVADGEGNGVLAIRHTTRPGFPLGAFRNLLTRLGIR